MPASAKSLLLLFCVLGVVRGKIKVFVCVDQFSVHRCVDKLVGVSCDQDVKESKLFVSVSSVNWMLGSIKFRWW